VSSVSTRVRSHPTSACARLGLALAAVTAIEVSSSGGFVFVSHWDTAVGIRAHTWLGPTGSAPSPTGLAALYPGDAGIENHPDVVFVEKFEESALSDLFNRWTDILNGPTLAFSSDVPQGSPGTHSLSIPWVGGGVNNGGHLYKQLNPAIDDTLYVRYYIKYPTNGQ